MTRLVLTFGLMAGAVLSAMMLATVPFMDRIGFDRGAVMGYTSMVLAFMLVFFGIRSYRDKYGNGEVSFGRALRVGLLITAVASACYVATWQLIYYAITPDFMDRYAAHVIERERAAGATAEAIERRAAQMQRHSELYRNPVINAAITLLEVVPVGTVMSALSAAILRRSRSTSSAVRASAPGGSLV